MAFQPAENLNNRTFVGLIIAQFLAGFNDQAIHASAMFYAIHTDILTEAQRHLADADPVLSPPGPSSARSPATSPTAISKTHALRRLEVRRGRHRPLAARRLLSRLHAGIPDGRRLDRAVLASS